MLSVLYRVHVSDFTARMLAVCIGLATVVVAYHVGRVLYDRSTGLAAAAVLAFMPYHVVVSRQALLDGTETLFATVALLCAAHYARSQQRSWLYALAASLGLTFLSKETGIVFAVSFFVFLALSPQVFVRVRDLAGASILGVLMLAVYPISVSFGGASSTSRSFLSWQFLRRSNHGITFYFTTALPAMGWVVVAVAIAGLIALWRTRSWREHLLLSWIVVPLLFFTFWPTKGYQYLLPAAPAVAVLAGHALGRLPLGRGEGATRRVVSAIVVCAVLASLFVASWVRTQPSTSSSYLAGTGGVPRGRQAGVWLAANVPEDARLLALGPSMANVLQFYGGRKVWGLSVSTNPLHRNPVYEPIVNPDLALRRNDIQYLVWDAYSANRSPRFAAQLLRYVARFHGRLVHSEVVGRGARQRQVIAIYAVRP
jgi:4-amino-4-deoxy-L-arabinose transferase-like glycosyltransferase